MMAGGALIAVWGGFKNRISTILLGNFIMGVCTIGLSMSPLLKTVFAFPVYLAFMGVFGIAIPLLNTPSTVLLQEHVEDAYLGRAFSLFSIISSSVMPLSMLIFGPLADTVSIEVILFASGVAMLILLVPVRANKRLMEAGRPVSSGETPSDSAAESSTESAL
jgi:DHA3 family macrolide efflux protein-like MFS transporter